MQVCSNPRTMLIERRAVKTLYTGTNVVKETAIRREFNYTYKGILVINLHSIAVM